MFEFSSKPPKGYNKFQEKQKKAVNYHKYIPTIIAIIAIIGIIAFYIYQNSLKNYNYIKKDSSKSLVETKYTNKNSKFPINIPDINIDSTEIGKVNDEIDKLTKDYIKRKNDVITYEYELNGIILSVVLKMINNNTGYAPEITFKTYNINLDKQIVVTDTDLLNLYGLTEQNVSDKIKATFEAFYQDEIKEGYIDKNECDYACFLQWRAITDYLAGAQLYIKKGQLIAYRPFIIHSLYGEEEYFKDSDFEFPLAKQ